MKARAQTAPRHPRPAGTTLSPLREQEQLTAKVTVRIRDGAELEGIGAHHDGISFRSPSPILGGRRMELVLCGVLLVEAEAVVCVSMPVPEAGYLVKARYLNASDALKSLIYTELTRLLNEAS